MKTTFTITNKKTEVTHQITLVHNQFRPKSKMDSEQFTKITHWLKSKLSHSLFPTIINPNLISKHMEIKIETTYGNFTTTRHETT